MKWILAGMTMSYIFLAIVSVGMAHAMNQLDQIQGKVVRDENSRGYCAHLVGGRVVYAFIDNQGQKNMRMFQVINKRQSDQLDVEGDPVKPAAYFDFLHDKYKEQSSGNK